MQESELNQSRRHRAFEMQCQFSINDKGCENAPNRSEGEEKDKLWRTHVRSPASMFSFLICLFGATFRHHFGFEETVVF